MKVLIIHHPYDEGLLPHRHICDEVYSFHLQPYDGGLPCIIVLITKTSLVHHHPYHEDLFHHHTFDEGISVYHQPHDERLSSPSSRR